VPDELDNIPIRNRYAEQFAADLAEKRKEQEAVSTEIARLQERLKQLKEDEGWLAGQLATAEGRRAATGEPGADDATAPRSVPRSRRADGETGAGAAASRGKKKTPAKPKPAVKKAAATKAAPKQAAPKQGAPKKPAAKKPGSPPLRDLIMDILLAHSGEPRTARDVQADLKDAHPERATSIQTVRNNLDALAKSGAIEKEHKQGSVMYTAYKPAQGEAPRPADAAAAPEPAGEDQDEKVTAEV
jgi:hypothetical protein